ncbi:hypothetical protein SeMB42_g02777 [Synchytrium endobioticum]|uniref:STB6-like N-terminal domain-containing protein n=1 Tax=Synchytrium endobioticum TaxID=286115 RepID=A0A507DBE7_9FUNG|nr:hypothetical protein SeLEV6574_g03509 [Synchytrium endobioticum]TPX49009.1 hypothetical protein SeMB42_g02777 [Synchytrium endobioticum]
MAGSTSSGSSSSANGFMRLLFAERAAAANLCHAFKPQINLIEPRTYLPGFCLYVQLDWLISRDHIGNSFLCYTGDSSQSVKVAILELDPTAAHEPVLQRIFSEYERDALATKRTQLGVAVCAQPDMFGDAAVQCVLIPDGDYEANIDNLYVNVNLKRFGCGERSILTCRPPTQVVKDKFYQLYSIDPNSAPINAAVVTLARTVQRALFVFAMFRDETWIDGLVCDMTLRALQQFYSEMGPFDDYDTEEGHWCDPVLFAAVLGALASLRFKLSTTGTNTRDPFLEPLAFRNQIETFQRQHGLPSTGLLDQATRHTILLLAATKSGGQPPAFVAPVVDVLNKLEDITGLPTGIARAQKSSNHRRNKSLQESTAALDLFASSGHPGSLEWDNDINQVVQHVYNGVPFKSWKAEKQWRRNRPLVPWLRAESQRPLTAERSQSSGSLNTSFITSPSSLDNFPASSTGETLPSPPQSDGNPASKGDNSPRRAETTSSPMSSSTVSSRPLRRDHGFPTRNEAQGSLGTLAPSDTTAASDNEGGSSLSAKGAAALRAPIKIAAGVARRVVAPADKLVRHGVKLLAGNITGNDVEYSEDATSSASSSSHMSSMISSIVGPSSNTNSYKRTSPARGCPPAKHPEFDLKPRNQIGSPLNSGPEEVLWQNVAIARARPQIVTRLLRRTRSLGDINFDIHQDQCLADGVDTALQGTSIDSMNLGGQISMPIPLRPNQSSLPAGTFLYSLSHIPRTTSFDRTTPRPRNSISVSSMREYRRLLGQIKRKSDALSSVVIDELTPLHAEALAKFTSIEGTLNSRTMVLGLAQAAYKNVSRTMDKLTRENSESTRGGLEERKRKVAFGLSLLEDRHKEAEGLAFAFDEELKSLELRLAQDTGINSAGDGRPRATSLTKSIPRSDHDDRVHADE